MLSCSLRISKGIIALVFCTVHSSIRTNKLISILKRTREAGLPAVFSFTLCSLLFCSASYYCTAAAVELVVSITCAFA